MKIAVMGVGAMGSVYAALLAEAGNDVWAIDTWAEHLDAIRQNGLRVEGASGDRIVTNVHAVSDVAEAGECDLYIIATKASGVEAAARSIARVMGGTSLVLTIQNGLGSGERIAQFMPTGNVLLGVADGFGASMKGPGHAHHNAMKLIRLGEMNGGLTERLAQVEQVWQRAGFNAKAFEDINQLIWEKFLCNVTFSAPCTVFDCTVGELMANPVWWDVATGCTREAYSCGIAKQISFGFDDPVAYVTAFGANMPDARPSMLLDHMAGRVSEIDAINGRVPVLGRELGIATPYNDTLCAIVRRHEEAFG
ncbi:MAG: 2-dehydropantoate 2-reductase [Anderseniella sp.]|nr:2-dehydropantoate 2-reductase [Anderseniella sp.]